MVQSGAQSETVQTISVQKDHQNPPKKIAQKSR